MMNVGQKTEWMLRFIEEHGHSKAIWILQAKMDAANSDWEYLEARSWWVWCITRLVLQTGNEKYFEEFGL